MAHAEIQTKLKFCYILVPGVPVSRLIICLTCCLDVVLIRSGSVTYCRLSSVLMVVVFLSGCTIVGATASVCPLLLSLWVCRESRRLRLFCKFIASSRSGRVAMSGIAKSGIDDPPSPTSFSAQNDAGSPCSSVFQRHICQK